MASSKMSACEPGVPVDSSYVPLDEDGMGDLLYSLRPHNPEMYVHYEGKEKTPKEMKEAVFRSERLQRVMEQVSQQSGRSREEVEAEVHALLEEMGHKFFMPALRVLAFAIRKGLRHISKGIYVNKDGVDMVKEAVRKWPVVLLPSHRSYLDFILVTYVFLHFNLRLPVIAAGQDFMEMAGVSAFLRRSGAFFMRRTFGSDQLYWSVFTEYVQQHLMRGYAPVEFFIEGTRSRTAKSLHPKLGLLSVIMEPYLTGHLSDVMLVPISVSYERTLEEELFSRELLGVPKPKESTKGLFKATSILSEDYGKIFITFNKPMSLHDYCMSLGVSGSGRALLLRGVSAGQAESRRLVLETGYEVISRIHRGMKLPTSALVATTILNNTGGIQLDDLVKHVIDLSYKVRVRGGQLMDATLDKEVVGMVCSRLHASVEVLSDGMVRPLASLPAGIPLQGSPIAMGIESIAKLSVDSGEMDVLLRVAAVHLTLAHYRNQLLHLFVGDAVLAATLQGRTSKSAAFERYKVLTAVLDKEFIFPRATSIEQGFQQLLQSFVDRGMVKMRRSKGDSSPAVIVVKDEKGVQFLADLVDPFIAGVWITCGHLLTLSGGVDSVTGVLKRTQLLAAKCVLSGAVGSTEVLSLDVIRNTLAALTQMALLSQVQGEFNTGKERLVKVLKQQKLQEVFDLLGSVVSGYQDATPVETASSLKARL